MNSSTQKNIASSGKPPVEELQIHIRITESGEICAWGLDQSGEERIFSLTGNLDLINKCNAMSYRFCG